MKHFNRFVILCLLSLWAFPLWAQQLMLTQDFQEVPFASVVTSYKNEFGKHTKLDGSFPFVLFQVQLEGNASEVKAAKQLLRIDLGRHTAVQDVYMDTPNEIWFLIPARARYIFMTCGDGCKEVMLMENARLTADKVHICRT